MNAICLLGHRVAGLIADFNGAIFLAMSLLREGLRAKNGDTGRVLAHDHFGACNGRLLLGESACVKFIKHHGLSVHLALLEGALVLAKI